MAVAAYALSLVSLLVSSYHGNTDSLCAMLCLLTAYLIDRQRPLAAGLAFAAALNVKLLPLVLVPAFALAFRSWRPTLRFGLGLAVAGVPFVPFVACCGSQVYRNVLAYNSYVDRWGIMAVLALSATNRAFADLARTISTLYVPHGRYVILGCILGASGWNVYTARWNAYQVGTIGCALFLVLTPGFGVHI